MERIFGYTRSTIWRKFLVYPDFPKTYFVKNRKYFVKSDVMKFAEKHNILPLEAING
jgi:hypothetical protein